MVLNQKNFQFPKIRDSNDFEKFCCSLWSRILSCRLDIHGRPGNKQHGVDLFGLNKSTGHWVGIQCKVREKKLTKNDISHDIEAAKTFNPKLNTFIIATTACRDAKLQDYIRSIQDKHYSEKLFDVKIASWDDIEEELNKDTNADLAKYCFGDHAIAKIQFRNLSLGRVISLSIGIDNKTDTGYELLIGKIADSENSANYHGLGYWKGSYFIVNLKARLMETFPLPVFESDIERAFPFSRDNFIIAKWLNSIKSIDDMIKCDSEESMMFQISHEEYSAWLKDRKS